MSSEKLVGFPVTSDCPKIKPPPEEARLIAPRIIPCL